MPSLPARRGSNQAALVASAAQIGRPDETSPASYAGRQTLSWQRRALAQVDIVPELSYSTRFYARMLKPLRIFPATKGPRPDSKAVPITEGPPVDALARIKDKAGGMGQILWNYGRLMFATGEGTLLALDLDTEDEHWMFVWNDEVEVELDSRRHVKKIIHKPVPGQPGKEYGPSEARAYRMWTPHPRASGEADSPMRSSSEVAEELIRLTKSVMATAVSRTTRGILLMPLEAAPPTETADGDENPENNPYMQDLLEAFEAMIENAGQPSAAAPWLNWIPYELMDRVRLVDLHKTENDYAEQSLRKEAVERLARGFDFPPEVLIGLGSTNHWAARQILDDMWRSHGMPIAQQFCDDLNDAYLRPALRQEGYEEWNEVLIAFDESEVVVKPDRSEDADNAADRGMISDEGYRSLKNIPEDYKPSPEEKALWISIKKPSREGPSRAQPDAAEGPPPPGPEGDSGRRTRVTASIEHELAGAVQMAVARCRQLAGLRIRQKERVCPECLEPANGSPDALVASVIGPEALERMGLSARTLVATGAETLADVLDEWGFSPDQSFILQAMVESYAASTLFESRQPTLPKGFASVLEGVKEASDGHS